MVLVEKNSIENLGYQTYPGWKIIEENVFHEKFRSIKHTLNVLTLDDNICLNANPSNANFATFFMEVSFNFSNIPNHSMVVYRSLFVYFFIYLDREQHSGNF